MSHQNSTISVNTIEPQSGTTLTIGQSGQDVVVNADSIKNNALKDAGGNALWTSNGSGTLSGINSGFGSAQVLISSETVSSAVASIAFTSGMDSTYKEYIFEWFNIKGVSAEVNWTFQVGAGYNTLLTSTTYRAYNGQSGTSGIGYITSDDQLGGQQRQRLIEGGGLSSDADSITAGELHLFAPSSTTQVKQWFSRGRQKKVGGPWSIDSFHAGYFDVTIALTQINFMFDSGNIAAGKIKMYGIK